MSDIF